MRKLVHVSLLLVIAALAYMLYGNIMEPIRFNHQKEHRYKAAIEKLKQIRIAERAYKSIYGRYTGSFDTLYTFIRSGAVAAEIGSMKLLAGINVDSLKYVPYTRGQQFSLAADRIETTSKVVVPVFECSVSNDVLLKGLNPQLIINLNDERIKTDRFPGVKVGSLTEATNDAGNWE